MIDKRQVVYDIERCISYVPDACRDCSHYTGTVGFGCMEKLMEDALPMLKEQPEIILCRDCKHHRKDTCSAGAGMAFPPPDDWFCADGERKEGRKKP